MMYLFFLCYTNALLVHKVQKLESRDDLVLASEGDLNLVLALLLQGEAVVLHLLLSVLFA